MNSKRQLAATGVLMILAACNGSATAASQTSQASTAPSPATQTVEGLVVGHSFPAYSVAIPMSWTQSDDGDFAYAESSPPEALGVSVWDVGKVPTDPCRWRGTMQRPGSTVDDVVAAFEAQKRHNVTPPTAVTVDGHNGQYFELTVPAGMRANAQSDFHGCDVKGKGHRDFISFLGDKGGERWEKVPGQVDRMWVIEMNGQPLVIDGTYSPDASQADQQQLSDVIDSIRFVSTP